MPNRSFEFFSPEVVSFLSDIKENNDREWFAAHKSIYETHLKTPVQQFGEVMVNELMSMTGLPHRSKVFRIYRDLRFSKDKRPYNAHIHMTFYCQGALADWYFALSPDQLTVGTGTFRFEKPNLITYRERVASREGAKLAKDLVAMTAKGVHINQPELVRVPSGFAVDHPRAALLRHKSLTVWYDLPDVMLATRPDFISQCMKRFSTLKPVFDWLGS